MLDHIENRRRNLAALVASQGGPTPLARILKLSGPSYLSQLTQGIRPVTEKTARKFERALGLPYGYLDRAPENKAPEPPATVKTTAVDVSLLTRCVVQIASELADQGVIASPETQGELLTIAHADASRTGVVDVQLVARLVRLLKSA